MDILDTIASPLASIGGGIASSAMGMYEAQQNRNFQENMANTTHQREVADLKKAGLNPILSAKLGGNPAPSGSMPTIPDMSSLGSTVNSARQTSSQVALIDAQARKTNSEADLASAQAVNAKAYAEADLGLKQNAVYQSDYDVSKPVLQNKLSQLISGTSSAKSAADMAAYGVPVKHLEGQAASSALDFVQMLKSWAQKSSTSTK